MSPCKRPGAATCGCSPMVDGWSTKDKYLSAQWETRFGHGRGLRSVHLSASGGLPAPRQSSLTDSGHFSITRMMAPTCGRAPQQFGGPVLADRVRRSSIAARSFCGIVSPLTERRRSGSRPCAAWAYPHLRAVLGSTSGKFGGGSGALGPSCGYGEAGKLPPSSDMTQVLLRRAKPRWQADIERSWTFSGHRSRGRPQVPLHRRVSGRSLAGHSASPPPCREARLRPAPKRCCRHASRAGTDVCGPPKTSSKRVKGTDRTAPSLLDTAYNSNPSQIEPRGTARRKTIGWWRKRH